MVAHAVDSYGRNDVLFNNSGISRVGSLHGTSEKLWDKVVSINVKGLFQSATIHHQIRNIRVNRDGYHAAGEADSETQDRRRR